MRRIISILSAVAVMASCIHNDLPYPVIEASITSMEVEGASSVEINSLKRVVSITLEETADIRNVQIRNIGFNVLKSSRPGISAVPGISPNLSS